MAYVVDVESLRLSATAARFEGRDHGAPVSLFITSHPPGAVVPLHRHPCWRPASSQRPVQGDQLNPVIPPNVLQERIALTEASTDADLRALSLSGDTVSWKDAVKKQVKRSSGLPPQ